MRGSQFRVLVVGGLVAAAAAPLAAQPTIKHDPVGCVVAGTHPKLAACFTPTSTVARTRAYFRPENGPNWYFVNGTSAAPCYDFVLPKLRKGNGQIKKMEYYIEVADREFKEARIEGRMVDVVSGSSECRSDLPVAPFLQNASVTVGGAAVAPTGFVVGGGIGTAALVTGGVVAAAAVGGGLALAGDDENTTPTPTLSSTAPPTAITPTPTSATATPTSTPTATPLSPPRFRAVFQVAPTFGIDPLVVGFNMCDSTGVNLRYFYDFTNDGIRDLAGPCNALRTYRLTGDFPALLPPGTEPEPQTKTYCARLTVRQNSGVDPQETSEIFCVTVQEKTSLTINALRPEPNRRVSWTSEVAGDATAQVVLNGNSAVYAGKGRSHGVAVGQRGQNRIEAQIVSGRGESLLTFDLSSTPTFVPGSLRVISGQLAGLTDTTVSFKVTGKRGERVAFTFGAGN